MAQQHTKAPGIVGRTLERIGRRLLAAQLQESRAMRREVDQLRTLTSRLLTRIEHLEGTRKKVDKVLSNQKSDQKYRVIFRRQLAAILRAQYLPTDLASAQALQNRRFRLRSQHEEDGVILALLQATGVGGRRFVEIGCGGTGGNSAVLAYELGWEGLMVDSSARGVAVARHEFASNPGVQVVQAMVTPESVNALVEDHGLAGEIDFLSIDIDSVDYWVFDALDVCRARVVVLEYNAYFGGSRAVTVPNAPRPEHATTEYFGASLAALEKAARRKGYRLVLCEDAGVNAFFVREGLAPEITGLSSEQAFRPFRHRLDDSHRIPSPAKVFKAIADSGLPLLEV